MESSQAVDQSGVPRKMSATMTMVDYSSTEVTNEFNYRPVPPLVPISAAFVFLSPLAFVWDAMTLVPLVGAVLGFLAWRQVRRSPADFSGGKLAAICAIVLLTTTVSAAGFHAYNFATEVPEGFQRVSFPNDISSKEFVTIEGEKKVHPDVEQLSGKPVFLKGFMYPTKQTEGLTSFLLCKDSGDCCFGGQPKQSDMIFVQMAEGQTANFRAGLVAVAGDFQAQPTLDATGLNPVYKIDAKIFSPAKTGY